MEKSKIILLLSGFAIVCSIVSIFISSSVEGSVVNDELFDVVSTQYVKHAGVLTTVKHVGTQCLYTYISDRNGTQITLTPLTQLTNADGTPFCTK